MADSTLAGDDLVQVGWWQPSRWGDYSQQTIVNSLWPVSMAPNDQWDQPVLPVYVSSEDVLCIFRGLATVLLGPDSATTA